MYMLVDRVTMEPAESETRGVRTRYEDKISQFNQIHAQRRKSTLKSTAFHIILIAC